MRRKEVKQDIGEGVRGRRMETGGGVGGGGSRCKTDETDADTLFTM